jgi:peptide/nickel transport system substrate-binding protein
MNQFAFLRPLFLIVVIISVTTICWKCRLKDPVVKTGTVNIRLEAAAVILNPILLKATGYSRFLAERIFSTLGTLDPETLELMPVLAKSIPTGRIVADGPYKGHYAYDFELQEAAAWDNGSPVTAADMIFTLKLIFHPGIDNTFRDYFPNLTTVEADPANPKKFTAYYKTYYMLSMESLCQTVIYPAYHYDPGKKLEKIALSDLTDLQKAQVITQSNPDFSAFAQEFTGPRYINDKNFVSGCGPYRLENTDAEQGALLIKKTNWWGDKLVAANPLLGAYPERLSYKIVKEESVIENMLKTGDLDIATNISPGKYKEWSQNAALTKDYDFLTKPAFQYSRWLFNLRNPKLADVRVRQALAQLIDYDYILSNIMQGLAARIVGPVSPAQTYYAKDIQPYEYNVQKAGALLKEAGWADSNSDGVLDKMIGGKKVELTIDMLATTASKVTELLSNSIRETARPAGVRINIIPVDIDKASADSRSGNYESVLLGAALSPGFVELHQRYHSSSIIPAGDNRSSFADPRADSLIMAIRTTPDDARRKQLYIEAQKLMHEQLPEVFVYTALQRFVVSKKFDYVLSANRPGYYEHLFRQK